MFGHADLRNSKPKDSGRGLKHYLGYCSVDVCETLNQEAFIDGKLEFMVRILRLKKSEMAAVA